MGLLDRFKREPTSRVHMLMSVDEFVAGQSYDIPVEVADRFIARGYAEGALSRVLSFAENLELQANHQTVTL